MAKVMFINPAGYIGGAEKSLIELVRSLPPERFQPLVVLLSPGPAEAALRESGIDCLVLPLSPTLLGLSRKKGKSLLLLLPAMLWLLLPVMIRLIQLIRTRNISIIHTNGIKAHLLGVILARLTGRPLVWHFRDLPGRGGYGRLFRRLGRIFPERIIANSRAVRKELGDLARIRVVYNGVAIPPMTEVEDRRAARKKLGLAEEAIAVGTVGHFAPLKGYEDLLSAVPAVREKIPAARFLITGDPIYPAYRDYRRQLEKVAAGLEISDRVIFTGGRDDPAEILSALDIFVLPSRSEGFGRANLEAMAAGLPVVSTRVGGIPEVVIDGETGVLVEPRAPAALAGAIITLAKDETLRGRLGRAGRRRAQDFSIEKMACGVMEVYDEILAKT